MKWEEWLAQLEVYFWGAANTAKDEIMLYRRRLRWILILGLGGVGFGVGISSIGYYYISPAIIGFGRLITGLSSVTASIFAIYLALKPGAILYGLAAANKLLIGLVREASRPLPDEPINLPQVFDNKTTAEIITSFLGCYAALAGFGAFAVMVPVYTLFSYFLGLYLVLIFLILGASTWSPTGKWLQRFQKGSLVLAVLTILLVTVLFFTPGAVGRWHERALLDAAQRKIEAEQFGSTKARIEQKQREKNNVLAAPNVDRATKMQRAKEIDEEIEFIRNGGSSWSDWFSGLFVAPKAFAKEIEPALPELPALPKALRNPDAGPPEVDMGSGPFYKNPDQTLLPRVSYKFATSNTVYVYKDDGKLHRFKDGGALFSYYGCAGGQRVIDCTPVYEIPARVKPGDSILGGAVVNGSE